MVASEVPEKKQESCGCAAKPRRLCDVCRTPTYVFTACSSACLEQHLATHTGVAKTAKERLSAHLAIMNRQAPDTWERYRAHRERVMELAQPEGSSHEPRGRIAIFGAGNCSDIDLEALTAAFSEVHLVDLDEEALVRARDRQSALVRDRIKPVGSIDLSGFLHRIEAWGSTFPTDAELAPLAVEAARATLARLGTTFNVVVSGCVLSQLLHAYQRTLVLSLAQWVSLEAALNGVHLTTLAGALERGGRGLIVFDVLSSDDAPGLLEHRHSDPLDLQAYVMREIEPGIMRPDPWNLARQLQSSLGGLFQNARLTTPWLWDIRTAYQLVYALVFERRY